MNLFKKNNMRCPVCLHEFNNDALMKLGIKGCPVCKTVLQPLEVRYDGYIKVNWQDLRTLAIYARRWSKIFDKRSKGDADALTALENIFNNLKGFRPVNAEQLLPLKDPVADSLRRIDVKEGGMMQIGDNVHHEMKPDKDGNIPSPFFRKL